MRARTCARARLFSRGMLISRRKRGRARKASRSDERVRPSLDTAEPHRTLTPTFAHAPTSPKLFDQLITLLCQQPQGHASRASTELAHHRRLAQLLRPTTRLYAEYALRGGGGATMRPRAVATVHDRLPLAIATRKNTTETSYICGKAPNRDPSELRAMRSAHSCDNTCAGLAMA